MVTDRTAAEGESPDGMAHVPPTVVAGRGSSKPDASAHSFERRLFVLLGIITLSAAFVTGLRTLSDPDFFWQLATGRWVAQHHHVFSTDVFSYTAAGQPWIYPVGSGLLFYSVYLVGGFGLLSWLGAIAACGTVALLLRKGSAVTAGLGIVAVPLIVSRTTPRAEMFSVVLFAAFLSILWENYRSGARRLWLLPVLMVAWVNLHLGFVSGLALLFAFAGMDVLEMLDRGCRPAAFERLRLAAPWYVATALSTLVNPWGWNIYLALVRQNRFMAEHSEWISEWGKMPLNTTVLAHAFDLHNPSAFHLLLVAAALAVVAALWQREWGIVCLLVGAANQGVQHLRMQALAACVMVVAGGSVLLPVVQPLGGRMRAARSQFVLAAAEAAAAIFLAGIWCVNALSISDFALSSPGTGLSWWFPERAVAYLERANIPGEIFNSYIQGGYLIWRLGPSHRAYIDGRAMPFGAGALLHHVQLLSSPPDSTTWQAEANRYNINVVLLPLNRFQSELGFVKGFCNSNNWKPVYLDELAAVFLRRGPQTEDLTRRSALNCATAPLPAEDPVGSSSVRFNQWANAAVILASLSRNDEALAAADKAREIVPDTGFVPWLRGNVAYSKGFLHEAEREYREAIHRSPELPLFWFSLAAVYKHEGRIPETIDAQRRAIDLSTTPKPFELLKLARLYLDTQQPKAALATFDEADRSASPDILAATGEHNFQFEVDQGRAEAWKGLGNTKKAAAFEQKAVLDLVPGE